MKLFRAVAIVAVIGLTAAAAVEAQGRAQRPATPRNPQATRPAPTRPAQAERRAARTNEARSNNARDIAANISRNPQQKARLEAMLPAGMTLDQAASGFRNQGQFIAALQASKNQNIPFDQLKVEMTGENALSLGQAVQKLKPEPQPQS